MALTPEQRARIFDAFLAMDPQAITDTGFLEPDWDAFMYEGRVTLEGLIALTDLITTITKKPYGYLFEQEADVYGYLE